MTREKNKAKILGDLPYRILFYGAAGLIVFLCIFFAQNSFFRWIFVGILGFVTATALWEYYQLVKKKGVYPLYQIGIGFSFLYIVAVFLKIQFKTHSVFFDNLPTLVLAATLFSCFVFSAVKNQSALLQIASSFLGVIYIALPLGCVEKILYFFSNYEGSLWLTYLIAITKSSDMGGYFIGRRYGKRKLAISVSPNKTLEGAIAGLLASIFVSYLMIYIGKFVAGVFTPVTFFSALWLGLLVGFFGQLGDLAESLLKRDAGVKDSNHIPGVGGILDMIDSLLFTAPIVYMFLKFYYP